MKIIVAIFLFFAFSSMALYAQKDSTKNTNDSLNATILADFKKKAIEIENQRINDSIKKTELEAQILSLKTTDNLKKDELQKQLDALNNQNAKRIAEKKARIDSLRLTAKSFAVNGFFEDTLFLIYSKLGSFSAQDRAAAIENRVKKLADIYGFKKDSLKVFENETTTDIMFGESTVISISENDALWNNATPQELAQTYQTIIGNAVTKYQAETTTISLLKDIGLAVLVLLVIGILIFYLQKLFKWIGTKISEQEGKRINGIKIKNYTLFDAKRQIGVLLSINTIIKWLLIVFAIYIALPILFGLFPWTKHFTDTLFGYILNPAKTMALGLWNYIPNLITIIVIYVVFRYVIKGLHFLKKEIENGDLTLTGFYTDWANPTYQILKVILYAFMFVLIFPYLPGSNSPVFQGVSVFLGVLFTFGFFWVIV